jgi:hypothetical protein
MFVSIFANRASDGAKIVGAQIPAPQLARGNTTKEAGLTGNRKTALMNSKSKKE